MFSAHLQSYFLLKLYSSGSYRFLQNSCTSRRPRLLIHYESKLVTRVLFLRQTTPFEESYQHFFVGVFSYMAKKRMCVIKEGRHKSQCFIQPLDHKTWTLISIICSCLLSVIPTSLFANRRFNPHPTFPSTDVHGLLRSRCSHNKCDCTEHIREVGASNPGATFGCSVSTVATLRCTQLAWIVGQVSAQYLSWSFISIK